MIEDYTREAGVRGLKKQLEEMCIRDRFEVFPGWIASTIALFVVSKMAGGPDAEITRGFENYQRLIRKEKTN